MSAVTVDVMIHIKDTLQHSALEEIRQLIQGRDGVVSARCNQERPQLILIEYDSEIVNSLYLLEMVKARGYSAGLIGL